MQNKKSKGADLENKKGVFFFFGLIISLGLVLLAFQWKTPPKEVVKWNNDKFVQEDFIYIPPATNEERKVPPKPLVVPDFKLVDNSSEIDENMDLFNTEPVNDPLFNYNDFIFTQKNKKIEKEEKIPVFVQEMPQFPGGDIALQRYIAKGIKYPQIVINNEIQGKVYISFVIDENGNVSTVEIVRGIDASLDNEALRVIRSLPKWKPGRQGGKAVKVIYYVPINFELH